MGWYKDRKDVEYCVKLASYDDVVKNKYNLSVSCYVEKEDTREVVDIDTLNARLNEVVAKEDRLRKDIMKAIKDL